MEYLKKSSTSASAKVLVALLGALVAAGGVWFVLYGVPESILKTLRTADIPAAPELGGTLYLTLARPNEDATGYALSPAIGYFRQNVTDLDEKTLAQYHSFSPSGNQVAFIGISDSEVAKADGSVADAIQVRSASMDGSAVFPHWLDTTPISKGSMPIKQNPSINETGHVLFMARDTFGPSDRILAPAEDWAIYLTSQTGTTRVARGTYPKWVNEEQFIFFKNNGLYLFNLADATERQIWDTPRSVESNMKLDISDDRQYVTWTMPDEGLVAVAKVTGDWSDGDPNLDLHGEIKAHGFWTIISPDSSFIALQAVDWAALETDPIPRLQFYTLDTLEKLDYEVPLLEFDQEQIFVTDWIQSN